jgi:hypothetical protein
MKDGVNNARRASAKPLSGSPPAMDTSPSGRAHPRGMLEGDARGWKMNPPKKKALFSSNFGRVFVSCEFRSRYGSSWRIKGKATFRKQIVDTKGK